MPVVVAAHATFVAQRFCTTPSAENVSGSADALFIASLFFHLVFLVCFELLLGGSGASDFLGLGCSDLLAV